MTRNRTILAITKERGENCTIDTTETLVTEGHNRMIRYHKVGGLYFRSASAVGRLGISWFWRRAR